MRSKEAVGKVFRIARIANGCISTKEVANLLGVSQSRISEIERGRKGLSLERFESFAKVYNFAPFELMELVEYYEELDGDELRKYQHTLLRALRILLSKNECQHEED